MLAACGSLLPFAVGAGVLSVLESARKIPVAAETGVLVLGGSSAAVSAALSAKAAGAEVFLVAPRPYLGDDVAGMLRLTLEDGETPDSALAKALWLDDTVNPPFTYKADVPSADPHRDCTGKALCDGVDSDIAKAVQFDAQKVKINTDLGAVMRVESIELAAYRKGGDFGVGRARFVTSTDGRNWSDATPLVREASDTDLQRWRAAVGREMRFAGIAVFRRENCRRMLLGEITFRARSSVPHRATPTPLHVKRTLDAALLSGGIRFITGAHATDVLRDAGGGIAGAVIANRGGRQAILARTIVDATERAVAARLAGAEFTRYPEGEYTFKRIVVSLDGPPAASGMKVRRLPGTYRADGLGRNARDGKMWECELSIPMKDGTFASFAAAEQTARDRTFTPGLLDASDSLFHVPPDRVSRGVPHIFVIGPCASASEAALRPIEYMRRGAEIGAAAARDAASRTLALDAAPAVSRASRLQAAATGGYEIREIRGFRHRCGSDLAEERDS